MNYCNTYESEFMTEIMGKTLRPGGFSLTEKGVKFCRLDTHDKVLDLGCGMGATVNYLYTEFGIKAEGIDPSSKLVDIARKENRFTTFFTGCGEELPFEDNSFNCVFAECTLSLVNSIDSVIRQVSRVLKDKGYFIITDVYARNPNETEHFKGITASGCIRNVYSLNSLEEKLTMEGFRIRLMEDCSDLLKELLVKTVFTYGSMNAFWNAGSDNCESGCDFQKALKPLKPGYFIMIAEKE